MKYIVIATLLLSPLCSFSQSEKTELNFEKGKKLELTMTTSSTSASVGESKMNASITRSFDVEDVINGNIQIAHQVKRIQFSIESMMANESFDSDKESDRNGDIGKALEPTLKSRYTMTVDPTGKVLTVNGGNSNATQNTDPGQGMVLGIIEQLAGKMTPPGAGDLMELLVLPGKQLTKGSQWTDSSQSKTTKYTVTEVTDNEILISYTEVAITEQKQDINGMTITINSTENTTGTIRVDRKTGLLKEKNANTSSEGTMSAMGQSMPMSTKTTRTWTLK